MGGTIEPTAARLVVNQDLFFRILSGDLERAQQRIVIYSPFMTRNRLANLEPQLKAAVERAVRVYIVTKPQTDRKKSELREYQAIERELKEWGLVVCHKAGMHEKLVFVDSDILWSGSLNTLSHSSSQDVMERRRSRTVFAEYARTIRLDDLIKEYDEDRLGCPCCGREVAAWEGGGARSRARGQPFYWRCTNERCGYWRKIGEPPPEDGAIRCPRCGGPVEYGDWGGAPVWRCLANRHHHRKLERWHLHVPAMRAIVSKKELKKLDSSLGITFPVPGTAPQSQDAQRFLFDE